MAFEQSMNIARHMMEVMKYRIDRSEKNMVRNEIFDKSLTFLCYKYCYRYIEGTENFGSSLWCIDC